MYSIRAFIVILVFKAVFISK